MQSHYYELLSSRSDLHFSVRYKLFSMGVYLRMKYAFFSLRNFCTIARHEIFIKTKFVIMTGIIPRGLDSREIATLLFQPASTVSLPVFRDTT